MAQQYHVSKNDIIRRIRAATEDYLSLLSFIPEQWIGECYKAYESVIAWLEIIESRNNDTGDRTQLVTTSHNVF